MNHFLKNIDAGWTLFLDRDGVLNEERPNDYVKNTSEFIFYSGALKALEIISRFFGLIIIVSNQKGIGKGVMTETDLQQIHSYMLTEIEKHNGRIDAIFFCPDIDDNSMNRKPNCGMALQAKNKFPAIDFSKSIMVGNKLSDMQFGKSVGMFTVFIASTNPEITLPHPLINARFTNLLEFAQAVEKEHFEQKLST
jgi:histidinol-phosphate phosphatase family protein